MYNHRHNGPWCLKAYKSFNFVNWRAIHDIECLPYYMISLNNLSTVGYPLNRFFLVCPPKTTTTTIIKDSRRWRARNRGMAGREGKRVNESRGKEVRQGRKEGTKTIERIARELETCLCFYLQFLVEKSWFFCRFPCWGLWGLSLTRILWWWT